MAGPLGIAASVCAEGNKSRLSELSSFSVTWNGYSGKESFCDVDETDDNDDRVFSSNNLDTLLIAVVLGPGVLEYNESCSECVQTGVIDGVEEDAFISVAKNVALLALGLPEYDGKGLSWLWLIFIELFVATEFCLDLD